MGYYKIKLIGTGFSLFLSLFSCKNQEQKKHTKNSDNEFIVATPNVNYPLPLIDNISNNCDDVKKRSIEENPSVYILRGINDIWQGTTDTYQKKSLANGPNLNNYIDGNPIKDSVVWKKNIQYVMKVTQNRTEDETILAFLDDVRSKFYSVTDGFGPLTEVYIKNSGAYVDLPPITKLQVLKDSLYQSEYNNDQKYAGFENSPLGAVVKLARSFQNTCSSTSAPKYLYSTPRPWRMNKNGEVKFKGTTYDSVSHNPTYEVTNYAGKKELKIYDIYESEVQVVPGLMSSRKNHKYIYNDENPTDKDLYTNTTENIRRDNGYPSGHTNAAALISLAYAYAFPERFQELVYRGSQLGEDRIIAGMHSPVDVIGGKTMALATACAALNNSEIANYAELAVETSYTFFKAKADSLDIDLYDYAHQKITNPTGYSANENINVSVFNNNIYDNIDSLKQIFRYRLTYGFPKDSTKIDDEPIVPKGAEAILKSRFPYLDNQQRRAVLYTTEIPSGYKITDKTNGWGRIDLVAAADGYGAFVEDVHVNMDASLGRFNAKDSWKNNISGKGGLVKSGTGKLILTGNNSYQGNTVINEGTIATTSKTALGIGQVTVNKNGKLDVKAPLTIKNTLKLKGEISLAIKANKEIILTCEKVILDNGKLNITFDKSLQPKKGDKFEIIQGDKIEGQFKTITIEGYQYHLENKNSTISIILD
ncbi:phosphatase PAP2 family protein [Zunongwangia sp.]|uniref:phosphatase PAP2 family protein n=1 Tax=Zunongwangia sp. TaxID=1965325 RepID=UPI003AA84C69